jgi:hypothetical protein
MPMFGLCRPRHNWLYQSKNSRLNALACSIESNRAGNPGRYLSVLNCASEYGLSVEVYGPNCPRPTLSVPFDAGGTLTLQSPTNHQLSQ